MKKCHERKVKLVAGNTGSGKLYVWGFFVFYFVVGGGGGVFFINLILSYRVCFS
jgi:hypothetical protein